MKPCVKRVPSRMSAASDSRPPCRSSRSCLPAAWNVPERWDRHRIGCNPTNHALRRDYSEASNLWSRHNSKGLRVGLLIRTLQRIAIFAIGAISVWLIAFVVFDWADKKLPMALAVAATYAIGAYVILPYAVRMGLKFSQLRSVPSFTLAADGLPADPVNLALIGTSEQL